MSKEHDTTATSEMVCPHCGTEQGDSWELQGESGVDKCAKCEREFKWTRDIEVTYNTEK